MNGQKKKEKKKKIRYCEAAFEKADVDTANPRVSSVKYLGFTLKYSEGIYLIHITGTIYF